MNTLDSQTPLPIIKPWLVNGFLWYSRRFIARRFHTFAVDATPYTTDMVPSDVPLIVFANHPGWWDPIVGALLRERFFPDRAMYCPIDASALEKYRVLSQMGFYGLDLHSHQGAKKFLRVSQSILESPKTSIWITPEGRFCDARDRSQPLMPGLAHLASRTPGIHCVPLAIEYVFWEEALPEALCMFGTPVRFSDATSVSKSEWHQALEAGLRNTQDELARKVISRDTSRFTTIASSVGNRSWYDFFRGLSSRLRGQKFDPHHGDKFRKT